MGTSCLTFRGLSRVHGSLGKKLLIFCLSAKSHGVDISYVRKASLGVMITAGITTEHRMYENGRRLKVDLNEGMILIQRPLNFEVGATNMRTVELWYRYEEDLSKCTV